VEERPRPVTIDPGQQALFAIPDPDPGEQSGYRGPVAAGAARITYRQLDYWARTGLVEPSVRAACGSGTTRLYSFGDILALQVVKRLLGTGVSLQSIRAAVATLQHRGAADLAAITLISDGVSVYECTSDDEVVDLVRGGQGVFGIALGAVASDVRGFLADVPPEPADAGAGAGDDRAGRRWLRSVG